MKRKVVSFLASGRGSNFKAVAARIVDGFIPAGLGILVCDKKDAGAFEIARQFGMESFHVDPARYSSRREFEDAMFSLFDEHGTDLIVAAGYMRILSPHFVEIFRNRIINIHPALLPSFPGVHAQKQAYDYGVKVTGCTTHFIDEGTDTGPIILQRPVRVMPGDTVETLSARILKEEHKILPESVKMFCENRLRVTGRRVTIKE